MTTSWQKFTTTFSVPSISGKTVGSNSWIGLAFFFTAGSDNDSRTNSLGNQSGIFDIAQVQLEEGPIATPFEQRPFGVEEQLCKRYWCMGKYKLGGRATAGSGNRDNIFFSTTMRVHPTVYLSNEVKSDEQHFPKLKAKSFYSLLKSSTSSDATTYYSEYSADAEL